MLKNSTVTYVSERLLPMSPVYTNGRGETARQRLPFALHGGENVVRQLIFVIAKPGRSRLMSDALPGKLKQSLKARAAATEIAAALS